MRSWKRSRAARSWRSGCELADLLAQLQSVYGEACRAVGTADTVQTRRGDDGSAHIEVHGAELHYVVTERGSELERKRTSDVDDAAYWLVSDRVFSLACAWESKHRVRGQDFRRLLFAHELALLAKARPDWAQRKATEIAAILAAHPYDDQACG